MQRLKKSSACLIFSVCLVAGISGIEVSSTYQQFMKSGDHIWAVGISELNVTFSNISGGTLVLRELDQSGTTINTCSFFGGDGDCISATGCTCRNISANLYEATYFMRVDASKNRTKIVLDVGGGASTVLGEALILLETCSNQENAKHSGSVGCTYNHFNCPTVFSCDDGFIEKEIYAVCMANVAWNETIDCIQTTQPTRMSDIAGTTNVRTTELITSSHLTIAEDSTKAEFTGLTDRNFTSETTQSPTDSDAEVTGTASTLSGGINISATAATTVSNFTVAGKTGLDGGAIAGIVVGVLVCVVAAGVVIWMFIQDKACFGGS